MKLFAFSKRCAKEILRDPINLAFGLCFPIILMLLLSAIQANIPAQIFTINQLAPGIAVFGLSFLTLFSATLIAKDRESALLQRLYTTPLLPSDFILGYMLPIIPMALIQTATCYLAAIMLGLKTTINIPLAILLNLPISIFQISLGLLCGSIMNVKQVGGICGALLTNLTAWLSGIWFDLELVGSAFQKIANLLPFFHAVELERAIINGNFSSITPHLIPVLCYAAVITVISVLLFLHQMKRQ